MRLSTARSTNSALLCGAFLALASVVCAADATFKVSIDAGASHRLDTPVFVEVPLKSAQQKGNAVVTADDKRFPGQIESRGDDRARVWWIVDDLAAGKTREYVVEIETGAPQGPAFTWKDSSTPPTKSLDLSFGDRSVLRYMHTPFDGTSKESLELTKKVFHHVFSPSGSRLITKGPGGLYPHHRGIYFGYNRCKFDDQMVDVWHAARGEHQIHKETQTEITGPVAGGHTLTILWNDRKGKPFVEERRTLVVFRQSTGNLLVEFRSVLHPKRQEVDLDGDRQHAGVQFRAAQEVAENQKKTRYLRPAGWSELAPDKQYNGAEHKDLPWNAIQYSLGDEEITVAYLSDPKNPDGAGFSERLYGRFGEFFPWKLTPDNLLSVRYRWWIRGSSGGGEKVTREAIEKRYEDVASPPKIQLIQ